MMTWNYTYHNLEIARNKFSSRKQMFPNHSAKKTLCGSTLVSDHSSLCVCSFKVRLYNLNLFDCDTEHKFCWLCF